ncbi:hypothetical protein FBZ89_107122 [Nitrospirillum amazonense]|uniref:Uncharacterized protein n=1 Tax=Nitrospirillum amazonense TaxID=28077 RepID=A0A560FFN8_9PROT|nr:hypothetical protein [Nitrospirillum amazonense]TWB20411.1 hypothetical protein FBZ89_107122 [Nitrospirillum amazonense]
MTARPKRDATAADRVRRYRQSTLGPRGIARVEVQAPVAAADALKAVAARWRQQFKLLPAAEPVLDRALSTINAPRPVPVDGPGLVALLLAPAPIEDWRPHVEAFFDEVSMGTLHDLVLSGVLTFEDLYRALRTWRLPDASNAAWITEMAALSLGRAAATHLGADRHTA